jgi:hypothetical protein
MGVSYLTLCEIFLEAAAGRDETLEIRIDRDRQSAILQQFLLGSQCRSPATDTGSRRSRRTVAETAGPAPYWGHCRIFPKEHVNGCCKSLLPFDQVWLPDYATKSSGFSVRPGTIVVCATP